MSTSTPIRQQGRNVLATLPFSFILLCAIQITAQGQYAVANNDVWKNAPASYPANYFQFLSKGEPSPTAPAKAGALLAVCAEDDSDADFNLGTPDANTLVVLQGGGAVILNPTLNEEFSGSSIPAGWTEGLFNPGGTTVSGGQVTVNGTHIYSNSNFAPGTSIEFVATFNSGRFQNVGFSNDQPFDTNPWVVIGQGSTADANLYARASDGSSINLGTLLGTPHLFKIKWNATNFEFFVDGSATPNATINLTVGTNMYLQISDVFSDDGTLSVDWLRATPYATSGSFTSQVFDQGAPNGWGAISWTSTEPTGTSIDVFVRTGNTPTPDGSWTAFLPMTNGGTVGGGAQYLQYRADLATTDDTYTPVLEALTVDCGAGPDVTPPLITSVMAVSAPDGLSATVTWATNEPANSLVEYGTSPGTLNDSESDGAFVTSHSIVLTGLTPGTTYHYRVSSEDVSTNSATEPEPPAAPLSFTTSTPPCFVDETAAHFEQGSFSDAYLTLFYNGIMLRPTAAAEFDVLPPSSEWESFPWTGGTSNVSGGVLSVDGARYNSQPEALTFAPGATLEFVATFGAAGFQHVGFGGGTDATGSGGIYNGESDWAMFSTFSSTTNLYARTKNGPTEVNFDLGSSLTGASHLYRIEWNAGSVDFYVDGALAHSEATAIGGTMRPAISDYNNGGPVLQVDWLHATPYLTPGTFESRVYDAGEQKNWAEATWTATVPAGATLQIAQRQGDTPTPDGSWTSFTNIPSSGSTVGGTSRYIQYRAELSTTDPAETPLLQDIQFACSSAAAVPPGITVKGNGVSIANRALSVSLADHTDFGSVNVSSGIVSRTFTIENIVNGEPLVLDGVPLVTIADRDASDFTVTTQPGTPILGGGGTSFTIEFDPSAPGLRSAIVIITHNDLPENPFVFTINGTGTGL
ncbi:MAG: choice-of-anchor D domain-containing protein [Saprospiraceae bacterium]|nr:choice-of-anchor D domain-containing protein [Saprospiraceae bacterium]